MGSLQGGTCEIIELKEEPVSETKMKGKDDENHLVQTVKKHSIEDDINKLFETIDVRTSFKGKDTSRKSALKKPLRVGSPALGIGISESMSLKQALRGLCISQASEMAAIRRSSKPLPLSRASEAGAIQKLYSTVVVEARGSSFPFNDGTRNLVEVSLVPETNKIEYNGDQRAHTSTSSDAMGQGAIKTATLDVISPSSTEVQNGILKDNLVQNCHLNSTESTSGTDSRENVIEVDEDISDSVEVTGITSASEGGQNSVMSSTSPQSSSSSVTKLSKSGGTAPQALRSKATSKKMKQDSPAGASKPHPCSEKLKIDVSPSRGKFIWETPSSTLENHREENEDASTASSCIDVNSSILHSSASKQGANTNHSKRIRDSVKKVQEKPLREKGDFSQSSKSSIGDYSSSTSVSEESSLSGCTRSGNRPHMSKDLRWQAIRYVEKQCHSFSMRNFKLLKRLGCGDIGTVYLAELIGTNCLFALKVMDNEFLVSRNKMPRAETEREIMQMLDHPFLPTLYSYFTTEKLSCLMMEYCPGGDLHVLRQKQPGRCFSEHAARFYVSEVLLALEYLHMLGVVYRDLKPENILVREDGHIMLTDFDLSLRCAVNPTLFKSSTPVVEPPKKMSSPCTNSSCIDPFCLQPSWQVSCFTPRLLSAAAKSRKIKSDIAAQVNLLPQLVVEPTSARSNSFVGTHEYLAPEIIKGGGHGSAVDWWTFGIFLYELLYGRTPFKGSGNEDTLANVVSQSLKFPGSPIVSFYARDLIRGLLVKEPENRLGSVKGATELKQHPFFEGLNWALVRCATPPELPKSDVVRTGSSRLASQKENPKSLKESPDTGEALEFDVF